MIEALATAIKARWDVTPDGDTLRAAVTGDLHPYPAPPAAAHPYATYLIFDTSRSYTKKPSYADEVQVQYAIWTDDSSPLAVMQHGALLFAHFAETLLTVSGYSTIRVDTRGPRMVENPEDKTHQYQLDLIYLLGS